MKVVSALVSIRPRLPSLKNKKNLILIELLVGWLIEGWGVAMKAAADPTGSYNKKLLAESASSPARSFSTSRIPAKHFCSTSIYDL